MEVLQEDEAPQAEVPAAIGQPTEEPDHRERIEKEFTELPVISAGGSFQSRSRLGRSLLRCAALTAPSTWNRISRTLS
jgi:hypothetical protein